MRVPLLRLSLALSFLLVACSPFRGDFRRASRDMERPPAGPEGPWIGEWRSKVNGHHGPIWCLVSPSADTPGSHDFRYRAGWGSLQFGDYTHTVPTRRGADGSLRLEDSMELPGGFGSYRVEGKVTSATFDATFHSRHDHGTMILRRPD